MMPRTGKPKTTTDRRNDEGHRLSWFFVLASLVVSPLIAGEAVAQRIGAVRPKRRSAK